ncbi:hypothetical protein FVEN_g2238 [Fusarium venenatum]|uniref:Heterokaryon incompatibility domain-containing protein n=2 Tax=Fusarium venenatum TaxID=56646 RepID=A0A2L2SPV0_9HYPO|nr:uncharacterized protein FVRRES_12667 [Fusarium venenatum]KAG8360482.1 hypothetical protein FVEN_g2238 [Fusarium venenatum]CEI39976.1 unnamed protein product [Fusarium venenatum]
METTETLSLCFSYRTVERDPSGGLDWGQRTRMSINDITLQAYLPDEFWLQIRPEVGCVLDKLLIDLRLRLLQETDGKHILPTELKQHASTLNSQNLQLASKWIKKCVRSHHICKAYQSQQSGWRPTRLVHVGSESQQPRLIVLSEDSIAAPYVALSYSWGSGYSATLCLENVHDFQKEIPAESLPNTIQDAIAITKTLGYEYIWIDALCIIQDSKEDWIEQSSMMGDIYGSATFTLAAAGNPNVKDTMSCRRNPRAIRPCVANIKPNTRYLGLSYPWAIYPNQPERLLANTINESPLSRRAWALQELLVSPRTLIFGPKQMVWSCTNVEASETFPLGLDPKFITPLNEDTSLSHLRQKLMRMSKEDESPSEFWDSFISRYTRAKLTVGSDTLVALQGIVERIITIAGTGNDPNGVPRKLDYVAGLWYDRNFQRSLLWRPKSGLPRRRPDTYRAPSWSWASLDGEIDSYDEYVPWIWNQKDVELASIVDISIEPRDVHGSLPTGKVTGGYLDMKCYLRPCHLLKNLTATESQMDEESSDALIITTEQHHRRIGDASLESYEEERDPSKRLPKFANSCILDFPDEIPESKWIQVYCVPLQLAWRQTDRYEQSIWESYEGLVLMSTEDDSSARTGKESEESGSGLDTSTCLDSLPVTQTFRRIGTFTFNLQEDNREAREDDLFGPMTHYKDNAPTRKTESIRVI